MRLAFISYEYAGAASGGGIGTYVRNAARMLADRGHDVHVFCADQLEDQRVDAGVTLTSIVSARTVFSDAIRAPFAKAHRERPFDVIEGPEYGADAAGIRKDFPDLPLIVRLHTPASIIDEINRSYISTASKMRFLAGSLRRGQIPKPYWQTDKTRHDPEREHTLEADLVVAPSYAIRDKLAVEWGLPAQRCMVVPNVFLPPIDLLALPPNPSSRTILFIGKLEVRKGVLELAAAVPIVARACPDVRFLMVGRSLPMPGSSRLVGDVMMDTYGSALRLVEHVDAVPYAEVPALFAQASIAVFPSAWEISQMSALRAWLQPEPSSAHRLAAWPR